MNRRDFLKGATLSSLGMAFTGVEIASAAQAAQNKPAAGAQAKPAAGAAQKPEVDDELKGRPVKCAVIGLGPRGREILTSLSRMGTFAPVVAICDSFSAPVFVKRPQAIVPQAKFVSDYKQVLANKDVEAVFIATPTHLHKEIAMEAIAAGKHVYCEAPLAHTVEDAKAIAQAAKSASTIFQPGLQVRCNAQTLHVSHFMESGALGKTAGARAQYHERTTWRVGHPDPTREAALNWRLNKDISPGLAGEVGIHQIDLATWYLKGLPVAVSGHGLIAAYQDGRTVPDTVQLVVEYPRNVNLMYEATLTNSFDGQYELFYGSESAVMIRDLRGWMFRESDAPLLGWEVFARKDPMKIGVPENNTGVGIATGIALVANATKQLALGKEPGKVGTDVSKSALYLSCRVFLNSVREGKRSFAKEPTKEVPKPPLAPGPLEGYVATVVALKANEAVKTKSRIEFKPEWFTI